MSRGEHFAKTQLPELRATRPEWIIPGRTLAPASMNLHARKFPTAPRCWGAKPAASFRLHARSRSNPEVEVLFTRGWKFRLQRGEYV